MSKHHSKASLLVLSWGPCALLSLLRCLGPRFGPVTLLTSEPDEVVLRSRHVRTAESFGDEDDAALVARIRRLKEAGAADAVVANDERSVLFLARNRAELASFVRVSPTSEPGTIGTVRDKRHFARLLSRLNLPHPRTVSSEDSGDPTGALQRAATELRFPVVVKPADLSCGFGITRCADADAMAAAVRLLSGQGRPWLIQEYFEGADLDICLVARDGRVVRWTSRCGTGAKVRFGEPSRWWDLRPFPEVFDAAARLVAELNWNGAFDLDCLVNRATGEWRILECNPRFGATTLADASAGVNLPEALALLALDLEIPPAACSPQRFYTGGLGFRALLGLGAGPRLSWNETYLPHVLHDPGPEWFAWRRSRRRPPSA